MARFDMYEKKPAGMDNYLSNYGWHFSKKMCEWAISMMKDNVYIINTSSRKFHLDGCDGAYNMSSKNKRVFEGSRQVLIDQGYEQCGNCRP